MKGWPKVKVGQVEVRITRLAHRKSYRVICPNAHEKLTKSEIRSSWSRFEHSSESLVSPVGSYIWSLFVPIHMKSLPKVKLGQVVVSSSTAQNHSSSPYEVIYGHYLSYFIWKVDQKWNKVKLESVRTLLKITCLVIKSLDRKSCMPIIGPNSYEKWPNMKLGRYYLLQSGCIYFIWPHVCPYLALLTCIYHYLPIFGPM